MPEVGIGFFPDVGATWFLPRMPGELGTYCGLTGERFNGADALAAGLATHRIPSARFPALIEGLAGTVSVDAVLARLRRAGGRGADHGAPRGDRPAVRRSTASRTFSPRSTARPASGSADAEWAGKTAATMRTKSPLSLKIALAAGAPRQATGISTRACAPNSA